MAQTLHSLPKIKEAIISLPDKDKAELSKWFAKIDNQIWDIEIEQDFQSGGQGQEWLDKIKVDYQTGKCSKWD